MRKLQLLKGVAGSIWFDAPEGRASAATVSIVAADGTALPTPVVAAAATVDAVTTTIASWSASTPAQATLAAITNIVIGRSYLITNHLGESAPVTVKGVDTAGKVVYFWHPLPFPIVGAACPFVGTRLSFAVVAANTATAKLNFVATWAYTVGSAYRRETLYDVCRMVPYMQATHAGLKKYAQGLVSAWEISATPQGSWLPWLEEAWEEILTEIEAKGNRANAMMDMGQMERVTYERVLLALAERTFLPVAYADQPDTWIKLRRDRYAAAMQTLLQCATVYDEDEDGVVETDETLADRWSVRLAR